MRVFIELSRSRQKPRLPTLTYLLDQFSRLDWVSIEKAVRDGTKRRRWTTLSRHGFLSKISSFDLGMSSSSWRIGGFEMRSKGVVSYATYYARKPTTYSLMHVVTWLLSLRSRSTWPVSCQSANNLLFLFSPVIIWYTVGWRNFCLYFRLHVAGSSLLLLL